MTAANPIMDRPYGLPDDTTLPYGRGDLTAIMPPSLVRSSLTSWHPFPQVVERAGWDALPGATRDTVLHHAEAALVTPWPELRASVFADYQRNGDRSRFELPHFERRGLLRDLVLGAGVSGDHRYTDPVLDAVWAICEESFWGVPAHSFSTRHARLPLPDVAEPVIDLFAAETGAQLAWTRYLMGDALVEAGGAGFDERVVTEIDRRLLTPLLDRDDWHWLARDNRNPNNWTPWIASNLLVAILHAEPDPDRRATLVSKIIASLDAYVSQLLPDGGCSEGQSYWAVGPAKLLDALDALRGASDGVLDGFGLPTVARLSTYPVAMHVGGREMVQHADGHGQWLLEGSVLHRAGRFLHDPEARQLAIHLRDLPAARSERSRTNLWRGLSELFEPGYADAPPAAAPLPARHWFPALQVLTARQHEGSTEGFFVAIKAGHNAEHHNQNDVGALSVVLDGRHVVVDPAVGVYTKQTFGPQRYELWEMNSDWHSLPIVSGAVQQPGREYAARAVGCHDSDDGVTMSADLAAAWSPDLGLDSYVRRTTLDRVREQVVVTDTWRGTGLSSLVLPLTLVAAPTLDERRADRVRSVTLRTAETVVELEVRGADRIETEEKWLDDPNLQALWGDRLWRLLITAPEPAEGEITLVFRRPRSARR